MGDNIKSEGGMDNMFESYCRLQSESYEFISRSIAMHNWVKEAYQLLQANPWVSQEELLKLWQPIFGRIYEHLFSPFLRPFRITLLPFGEMLRTQLRSFMPPEAANSALQMYDLWSDAQNKFMKNLAGTFSLYKQNNGFREKAEADIDGVEKVTPVDLIGKAADKEVNGCCTVMDQYLGMLGEHQFLIPKALILSLREVVSAYPEASRATRTYESTFLKTWETALRRFTAQVKESNAASDFKAFFESYRGILSQEYGQLLKSPDFASVQADFLEKNSHFIA